MRGTTVVEELELDAGEVGMGLTRVEQVPPNGHVVPREGYY
jgi:hypothetical protein